MPLILRASCRWAEVASLDAWISLREKTDLLATWRRSGGDRKANSIRRNISTDGKGQPITRIFEQFTLGNS